MRREFPREGFTILCDKDGLEVRVDDYHPLPLKLRWVLIEQWRAEAQAPDASRESGAD